MLLGNPALRTVIFRLGCLADSTGWARRWGHVEEEGVVCQKQVQKIYKNKSQQSHGECLALNISRR